MSGAQHVNPPIGLAEQGAALGEPILAAWDAFLACVDSADLSKPSRLKGLSGRDVLIHLATWDDHQVLSGLVKAAESGDDTASGSQDDINRALIERHTDATNDDVRKALDRSRSAVADFFASDGPSKVGRHVVKSTVGELPLLSVLHAGCYELAVHALDLKPCDADAPSDALLDRGVAALIDVTGALSAARDITMSLTAHTPDRGWAFQSRADGWTVKESSGSFDGPGVRGTAADLLDASAGRAQLPTLLVQRRLKVQDMGGFLRLAPMVNDVPGLPGGAVLRGGINALSSLGGGLSRAWTKIRG